MPYLRTWNSSYEATPAGSDMRSTVDDRIRELKADIRERMESLGNWTTTDPVSLKSSAPVDHVGKVLWLHPSDFTIVGSSATYPGIRPDGGFRYSSVAAPTTIVAGILIPSGCEVTQISAKFLNETGITVATQLTVSYIDWNANSNVPVATDPKSWINNQTGLSTISTPFTIGPDKVYYISVYMESGNNITPTIFGVKVTYTVPTFAQLR